MFSLVTKTFRAALLPRLSLTYKFSQNFTALALAVTKSNTPAVLERKPDALLVEQWWSQTPFELNKPLAVPVFSFRNGDFLGENVELDHSVFNVPLRRDIVHNVYHWRMRLGKTTTHISRTVGTTAGSRKKPFAQKKTGRARQGNIRAPGRKKGGKAHGAKPRDLSLEIPRKLRLQALKVLLSAKLAEGKIRIVDTEKIEAPKTKLVAQMVDQYDEKCRTLVITGYNTDPNFQIAYKNIPTLDMSKPHRLNVLKLLKADKLIITKEGLDQVVQNLKDRTSLRYRVGQRYGRETLPSEAQRMEAFNIKPKAAEPEYDPTQPLNFKFKILQDYLKDYEAKKSGAGDKTKGQ